METKKFKRFKFSGFTLVELIVVITILVILGTIAFLNLGGFQSSARDSVRVENLSNLQKGLNIFQIKSGTYPMPDAPVNITASGVIIGYQGFAKELVGGIANMSQGATIDPSDTSIYTTYSVNSDRTRIQLMGFLEDGNNVTAFIPNTYAGVGTNYSKRSPLVKGDSLGILVGNSGSSLNQPVQESGSGVDVILTNTVYLVVFGKDNSVSGSGNIMFTHIYNRRTDLLAIKNFASLDSSLIGYWDMETLTGVLLKDLSQYGNNGICYNSGLTVNCGGSSGGPQIVNGNGGIRKGMSFDGGDAINIPTNSNLFTPNNWTRIIALKSTSSDANNHDAWTERSITDKFLVRVDLGNYDYYYYGGVGIFPNNTNNIPGQNNFNSLAIKKNGTNISFYINGVLMKTVSNGVNFPNDSAQIIFGATDLTASVPQSFIGSIDDVRIYNRALSDSEIIALYHTTK